MTKDDLRGRSDRAPRAISSVPENQLLSLEEYPFDKHTEDELWGLFIVRYTARSIWNEESSRGTRSYYKIEVTQTAHCAYTASDRGFRPWLYTEVEEAFRDWERAAGRSWIPDDAPVQIVIHHLTYSRHQ